MTAFEQLILDSVAFNDGTTWDMESLSMPPPPKRPEWISGADSDGAILARDPLHENRVIEAKLRVVQQATKDLALAKIATLVDKFEECERNERGLPLTWSPADATTSAVVFRCLSGEITEMPIDVQDSGWMVRAPTVTVRLMCLPFWEGIEALNASVTSSAPIITLELSGITGDVTALGRLVVTDAAAQARRYVAWGLESRWYPTSAPPSLIVDSAGMTATAAAATATRTGSYSGATNNVISATLRTWPQSIATIGNLTHVGTFRPQLRYYASAVTMALRLTYQSLDGPFRSLSYKIPAVIGWNHVDLGLVTIPSSVLGSQKWTGRIEAYSTLTGGETFAIDALWLIPSEQFGRARATYAYEPGVVVGYDDFTSLGVGAVLTGRVAPLGGTWATGASPPATDFTGNASTNVTRATISDASRRFAILGSTSYTNVEFETSMQVTTAVGVLQGIAVRWVDASNYLGLTLDRGTLTFFCQIAASPTVSVATTVGGWAVSTWYKLRIVAYATGQAYASMMDVNGAVLATLALRDSTLATGGTLATGKPGFFELAASGAASTRYYDSPYVGTPALEPLVLNASQSIEFRHDESALREDSTGTYAGQPPEYVGPSSFLLPPAGGPSRKARVAVVARRGDVELTADDDLVSNATTDSTTVQVYAIPRGLAVPR